MTFKIAKTELRNLFYSPVAWFLLIAFLVQGAVFYTIPLTSVARWQDVAIENNPKFKDFGLSLTRLIFMGTDGIFVNVMQNLYLFVPLLTMGIISREINSGTIKLLYSSPVKIRHILFGKYLAVMIFNLLLVSIVGVFMITGALTIHAVDYGVLLSAAFGFYLLICAYAAIGVFMSSLTTYQIVSAIGTFIVIFILSRIGGLWQKYDLVRDLTYFLSLSGRTQKMLVGLITTKDVIYFLVIICLFLGFTLIRLGGARGTSPWFIKAGKYMAVITVALLIGYITSRPATTLYWDTTADNTNTIHERTRKIIGQMDKESPLEVTLYTNLIGTGADQGSPEGRNSYLSSLWDQYLRFKPDIQFKYEYYYDYDASADSTLYKQFPGKSLRQIAEKIAFGRETDLSGYKSPEEMHQRIDLQPEAYRAVMQLKYKGRTTFLRTFDDGLFWPEEMQVAPALKRLLQAQMPKILFLTGNLERSIYKTGEREYWRHSIAKGNRYALINLGFDFDTLAQSSTDIPTDIASLVIADPKTALSTQTLDKVKRYIDRGGNLFILGEPGKQAILNPVLQQLGVQLMPGTLVEPSKDEMPHMVKPYLTATSANLAEEYVLQILKEAMKKKDSEDTMFTMLPGATAIACDTAGGPFTIQPLLLTEGDKTWLKAGTLVTDSVPPVYSPQDGDIHTPFTTAVSLTRKHSNKEQRIVVCGDADFMSTLRNGGDFMGRAIYSWLDNNEFPIYTPRPRPRDAKLTINLAMANALRITYVWILPALILLAATILLIRRKRK
ncbi:Gldg family protein [Chitinophaga sp.]|uniref:Gldg family protein n=1 Tax=Chitinophaga sp. TaxID=1869181 RepID=UPI0025BC110B|nr:Gldg family protein [Chitinophaga sp.]